MLFFGVTKVGIPQTAAGLIVAGALPGNKK